MTKYHKELNEIADAINKAECLIHKIEVNRRYNCYYVDRVAKDGRFFGATFAGNYNDTLTYLRGLQHAIWYSKPF